MSSPFYLLKTRRFAPLFGAQFLGAFNDNLFKNTFAVILTFQAAEWTELGAGLLAPLIGAVFILPFFLFSGLAGEVADRYDKARLARLVKLWELLLMAAAAAGFYFHSFGTLLLVIFALGMHSTLFGPIKYSIIPQHMHENELVSANALVESGTFAAILLGTIAGGVLAGIENGGVIASVAGMGCAAAGYLFSRRIPPAPPAQQRGELSWNLFSQTADALRLAYRDRKVFGAVVSISWFWLYGALLLTQFPALAKTLFMGDEATVTLMLALFTLGIGAGSMVCERLSRHRIRLSLVAVGALGMGIAGADFAWGVGAFSPDGTLYGNGAFWRIVVDLMALGAFGGLYSVPLYALVQERSAPQIRSRVIAANNILNALFMVSGALVTMAVLGSGGEISDLFMAVALLTVLAGASAWPRKGRLEEGD